MIIGIEGGLGSGKTVLIVKYLKKDQENGNNIITNFVLIGIPHKTLDVQNILDMSKENININNVSIGIDEITVLMDCRRSSSKRNLMLSYFVLQSRKRNVVLYYTTQDFGMVDLRLMKYTDIQIVCDFIYDENGNSIEDYRYYTIYDTRDRKNIRISRFAMNITKYFKYYDTNEIILPTI